MSAFNISNGSDDVCEFTSGSPFPTWLTKLQTIFLILSLFSSLLLNAPFTLVVIISKLFQQRDAMISLVLTISNICYSVITNIPSMASVINGQWPFGKPLCYTIGTINFFLALLRHVVLLALTVDRFGSVMYPFHYPRHSTKAMAVIFAIGSLYCAAVSLGFDAHFAGCYNFDENAHCCRCFANCSEIWCNIYYFLLVLITVSFGVVVPFVLSCLMFCKANKHRQRIACGNESGTFGNVERVSSDAITYRSQDRRAVVTLLLLIASIVVFSLPYIIFAGAHVPVRPGSPASLIALLVGDMYLLIPTVNAIVVWRNRDIKESAMTLYKRMRNMFVQCVSK